MEVKKYSLLFRVKGRTPVAAVTAAAAEAVARAEETEPLIFPHSAASHQPCSWGLFFLLFLCPLKLWIRWAYVHIPEEPLVCFGVRGLIGSRVESPSLL